MKKEKSILYEEEEQSDMFHVYSNVYSQHERSNIRKIVSTLPREMFYSVSSELAKCKNWEKCEKYVVGNFRNLSK